MNNTTPTNKPRQIITNPLPERFARGWHCLGLAKQFDDKPTSLNYFGQRLVAYRGEDNQIHILDAWCPHMGADLSLGRVEGNSLRCPFHAWRWGADGLCDDIPYADAIPQAACIKSWPTCEVNDLLFVWHDPEGNAPIVEQAIPVIEDVGSAQWTDWSMAQMTINTHCRELIDNMADFAHFAPVHGSPVASFKNIVDGHTFSQILQGSSERLGADSSLSSIATYYGPAYMVTQMTGQLDGMSINSRLLVAHVPITMESFVLFFGVMVKKQASLSEQQNQQMVEEYVKLSQEAFFEDVHIWHNKIRVDNPLLCNGDGPVNVLRKWYQQFYTDVAAIHPEQFAYKEYTLTPRGHQLLMPKTA